MKRSDKEPENFNPKLYAKHFIIPKNNTDPFFIVCAFYDKDTKYGQVFCEGHNPLSYYYPVQMFDFTEVFSKDEAEKVHQQMIKKFTEVKEKNGY